MYETFVRYNIGKPRILTLKKSDVKRYYNYLADERKLKASTIDSIHTVIHQILNMAVDSNLIFINRFGQAQHQTALNKAVRWIIRDCNDEQLLKDENAEVLLPHFSCHTFTTSVRGRGKCKGHSGYARTQGHLHDTECDKGTKAF